MSKAADLIQSIRDEGFDDQAIDDALCDGAYLATLGDAYSQEDIEEAHGIMIRKIAADGRVRRG